MSISKRRKESGPTMKSMHHNNNTFLSRITKTLYYGKLPKTERLSLPATQMASELFSETHQKNQTLQRLYCEDAALISRNACVSPCQFVLALLYLERLKNCNPEYVDDVAPSKLFLVSLLVSSKFLYDEGLSDAVYMNEWAESADLTVTELCELEKEFLNAIEWNIFVTESTFWERLKKLERSLASREGNKRGWFTYTELDTLVKLYGVTDILNSVIAISVVLLATYTVGILTIMGSMFLTSQIPGTALYPKQTVETEMLVDKNDTDLSIIKENEMYIETSVPINVLKTSFLLASIKPCNDSQSYEIENNEMTWDWWNNRIMNWLYEISAVKSYKTFILPDNYYKNFGRDKLADMTVAIHKKLQLEDKIHKATKLRLQEQMERSWHQEWTDTILMKLQPFFSPVCAL